MSKVVSFVKDSYVELTEKVTWPTTKVLLSSSVTVLVASVILALTIFLMDFTFGNNPDGIGWDGLLGLFYKN